MATQHYIALNGTTLTEVVPNTTSAGGADAGKIIALNGSGQLDPTMLPSGVGVNAQTAVTSAAISAGQMVNLYAVGSVLTARPADCTAVGSEANAYATAAVASGATGTFNLSGIVTGLSALTAGTIYCLSTVGAISTTKPSSAGNIMQIVGKALSTTSLVFEPQSPITVAVG